MVDISYYQDEIEDHLNFYGWEMTNDRGCQGVYYRCDDQGATLTIWYQTGKYRTTLDKGVHPKHNRQMYNKTDDAYDDDIKDEIIEVAEDVRIHTNNRYSDARLANTKCFKCGVFGHRKNDCPNAYAVCYSCREPGHESRDCNN